MTVSTDIITTIVGCSKNSYNADNIPGTSASLYNPVRIFIDTTGNVYIADYSNHRVRKFTVSTGLISTVAGTGTASYSGDNGQATSATLSSPTGLAIDNSNNLYIAEYGNHRVRKVDATGIITTIAGTGATTMSGDNGAATSATLYYPYGVALDSSGNVHIADYMHCRIRKVTVSTGIITTIAGTGASSYSGDGGAATSAAIKFPMGVALDSSGASTNFFHIFSV